MAGRMERYFGALGDGVRLAERQADDPVFAGHPFGHQTAGSLGTYGDPMSGYMIEMGVRYEGSGFGVSAVQMPADLRKKESSLKFDLPHLGKGHA